MIRTIYNYRNRQYIIYKLSIFIYTNTRFIASQIRRKRHFLKIGGESIPVKFTAY